MQITRSISWLKPILVLSLVCCLTLTATAQDYYPATIGNTWVFLSTDGAERRTYSIEEPETNEGEGIIILRILTETLGTDTVDNDVYFISDDAGDLKLHSTRLEEGTFGIAAAMLDPPALFFPADLPLGQTWEVITTTELNLVGTANTTSTITVVAVEDVETPIGTIEGCVKLEISRKIVTALVTLRSVSYQWLGPDLGPVKYEDDQGIVYELQSYNLVDELAEEPVVETPADIFVNPVNIESPAVGEQFTVSINIGNGEGVAGYQLTVNFDPTALKYISSANGDYLPAGASVELAEVSENSVQLAATASEGESEGHGTLATVTFEVVEVKASSISLTDVVITNATAEPLEFVTEDGAVLLPIDQEPIVELPPGIPPIGDQVFEITLTNLTTGEPGMGGQIFSHPIFATHFASDGLATVGEPAIPALVTLAENGDVSGLLEFATAIGADTAVADDVVIPGESVTVRLKGNILNSALTVASMLVSTNDGFIAASDIPLYDENGMPISTTLELMAYDAGSEENTELASDIPGPLGLDADADPEGSNARVPTVGGVITPHPGIQGVGDVSEAFAWTEPTATLTITPISEEETPTESSFDIDHVSGLNLISIPLMPTEPYTAKSLAEMLSATVVIKLDAAKQSFVGYSAAEEEDGFGIDGMSGYIVNTPEGGKVTFTGTAWQKPSDDAPSAPKISTNKSAWAFVITSNLQSEEKDATYTMVAKNLRTSVVASEEVTTDKEYVSAVWANLNRKSVVKVDDKIEIALVDEKGTIVSGPFQRTVTATDIHNAYLSVQMRVGDVRPRETILAQNFPNPFNPETWIPYQLSRDTNVTIQIYDVSGHSVRTLNLGHKSIGSYMTSSTAAYWDGKNGAGEHVSSGIYFYALQTENFSETRRMVILK